MLSDFKKQHLIVFTIMAALFFGAGVKYGMYLDRMKTEPVIITENETTADSSPVKSIPSPVVVHVTGAVERPGVFTMPEGARVIDAVNEAEPLPEAYLDGINLAKKLVDQERIVVPFLQSKTENGTPEVNLTLPQETAVNTGMISINTAGEQELESLPGIGPAKSKAIIQYREENGPFVSLEDIQKVSGIGPATFEKIKDQITL